MCLDGAFRAIRVKIHRGQKNKKHFGQIIDQSNIYSANIPGVARLSDTTARSVLKYKVVVAIP